MPSATAPGTGEVDGNELRGREGEIDDERWQERERERERAWERQTDLVKRDLVKRGEVDGDERRWANDSVEERGRNRRSGGEETRRDEERGGRKEERVGGQGGVLSEFCTWGYLGLDTHCGLKYLRQMASDFKEPIRSILHWEVSFL